MKRIGHWLVCCNFRYVPVFTLCRLSVEFWKASKIFFFVFLLSNKSTTRNTELVSNILIKATFLKFFYFQSHFMKLPFCGHFYRASHQQSNSNIRILWHSNWNISKAVFSASKNLIGKIVPIKDSFLIFGKNQN